MMKKIFLTHKIILLALVMGFFTACEDFLDENPTGSLTTESDVSSADVAQAFVNSAYARITVLNNGGGGWGGNNASLMEFMTGKADGNSQTEFRPLRTLPTPRLCHP